MAARRKKSMVDRRGAKRNPLQDLRIQVTYSPEGVVGQEPFQGMLLDIARTGMGLALFTSSFSESTHQLGAKFNFEFTLPGKPMIKVDGHIVWARAMGGKKARMGVKFSDPNPYLRKVVEEFLQSIADQ